jgi:hypothetical protein
MNQSYQTIAFLDCFSGISGDMLLGALLDAGLPLEHLRESLSRLGLSGFRLEAQPVGTGALAGTRVRITTEKEEGHRSWSTIRGIIEESGLAPKIKADALAVFGLLAAAEARVHGCAPDEVHFHEVGAVDSIVDIVGVAIGLDYLGAQKIISSPLPMPRGWVRCEHGLLPLPAPAVCEILKEVPVYGSELQQELVTPTGAAIVKALSSGFGPMPPMTIQRLGYGAGSRELANGQPNLLRLIIGTERSTAETQEVEVIETHLDDWVAEGFPYLCERLFSLAALDVALVPMQMKKGRPGYLLRVVADPAHAHALKQCIFSETTAIGLRFRKEERWTLPREAGFVKTRLGRIQVKKVETPAGALLSPEYEHCREVAVAHDIPLREVYAEVQRCGPDDFIPMEENHG